MPPTHFRSFGHVRELEESGRATRLGLASGDAEMSALRSTCPGTLADRIAQLDAAMAPYIVRMQDGSARRGDVAVGTRRG